MARNVYFAQDFGGVKMYDSRPETINHIDKVKELLSKFSNELAIRGLIHDVSKLRDKEKPIFDEYTPKLKDCTYGSDEYKSYLSEMQVALKHHYSENKHHPEHYENGIKGMTLIDICEMICDWKAATLRHNDGDIMKSIELNQNRFGYSDELKQILINTVNAMF